MSMGDPNAPVTLVEYAMFTCPHCAAFAKDVFPKIKANYIDTGKVRLVFREVYFNKPALWAAMIARCAPAGPLFRHRRRALRAPSRAGRRSTDPQAMLGKLYGIGRQAGLTDAEMDACMQDRAMAEALVAEYQKNAGGRRRRRDPDLPHQREEGGQHALRGVRGEARRRARRLRRAGARAATGASRGTGAMSGDFMEALGRAAAAALARRPGEAARIVGAALAGQPAAREAEPRPAARPRLDPDAEVVEPGSRPERPRWPLREVLRASARGSGPGRCRASRCRRRRCRRGRRSWRGASPARPGRADYRLYVPTPAAGAAAGARADAARLPADAGGLRDRDGDERAGRDAPAAGGLSRADRGAQPARLLELVPAGRPAARRRRAGDPRRAGAGAGGGVRHRPGAGLRRRALGRRRHGGGAGRDLSGRLRRDRGAFRAAGGGGERRGLGLRRHARRGRAAASRDRGGGPAGHRLPRQRRRDGAAGQRRADRRGARGRARGARLGRAGGAISRRVFRGGRARALDDRGRPGTPGRAAGRRGPTPIRAGRTPRRRWCGSSWRERPAVPGGPPAAYLRPRRWEGAIRRPAGGGRGRRRGGSSRRARGGRGGPGPCGGRRRAGGRRPSRW